MPTHPPKPAKLPDLKTLPLIISYPTGKVQIDTSFVNAASLRRSRTPFLTPGFPAAGGAPIPPFKAFQCAVPPYPHRLLEPIFPAATASPILRIRHRIDHAFTIRLGALRTLASPAGVLFVLIHGIKVDPIIPRPLSPCHGEHRPPRKAVKPSSIAVQEWLYGRVRPV